MQDAGDELRTPLTSLRANIEFLVMLLATDDVMRAEPDTEVDLAVIAGEAPERFRRRTERIVEMTPGPVARFP